MGKRGRQEAYFEQITDSKEVMQASVPPVARWFLTILLAAVLLALLFLLLMRHDVAVSAQGIIEPGTQAEAVTAVAGGKVAEVKVANGAEVHAGDALVVLDIGYAQSQLGVYQGQLDAANQRLASLNTLKQSYLDSTNLLAVEDPLYSMYQDYLAERNIITETNRVESTQSAQTQQGSTALAGLYQQRIGDLNWKIGEYQRLQGAMADSEGFSSPDAYAMSIYRSFTSERSVYQQALDAAAAKYAEAERGLAAGVLEQADVDAAKQAEDSAQLQLNSVLASYNTQAQTVVEQASSQITAYQDQIAQASSQAGAADKGQLVTLTLTQLREQKISEAQTLLDTATQARDACQLQVNDLQQQIANGTITASSDGTVMFDDQLTAGEVIQPGTAILHIVPAAGRPRVVLMVADKDIAQVSHGQKVLLSVSAYPYQQYGRLQCTVDYISATSMPVEGAGQFYRVEAALDSSTLQKAGSPAQEASAGMTVQADIVSGQETWMTWLLKQLNLTEQ
ncbi:MAG: HlyD family efflux transporter periplasmic adaptor subunit [Actinomycetia bacterium]|nr:HlyD family efflux transporter periplasmic adaptor subunit [Actinomycetes bacterium]